MAQCRARIVDIRDWSALDRAMAEAAVSQRRVLGQFTVEAMCARYARPYRGLGIAV